MSEQQAETTLQLQILVLGSRSTGKKTLVQLWQNSSIASAVNQFAQVQLRIQDGISHDMLDTLSNDSNLLSTSVFLILYIRSNEESIGYCRRCLQLLNSSLSKKLLKIFLLENSTDPSCQPSFSPSSELSCLGMEKVQCPLLLANVSSPMQVHLVFEHTVLGPLLDSLPPPACQEIVSRACSQGRTIVLKLMLGRGMDPQPLDWLELVFQSMEDHIRDEQQILALLEVAEFTHNIAQQPSKQFALTHISKYPRASLLALTRFSDPANKLPNQLLIPSLDLSSIPKLGIADAPFTHVSLEHNKLAYIPDELLQLQKMTSLDLSHNLLEQIPSILHWNCPHLQRLNLSNNCLIDTSLGLFKNSTVGSNNSSLFHDEDPHTGLQQRMIQLTGHNLYPCIFSIMWVNLSGNHRLTRIPEWVCVLPKLVTLNIRNMPKIKKLLPQLAYWKKLAFIKLDSERFVSPPASVCARGSLAIVAYLRCQLRGSMHYRHMKLMLLGESGSGKTAIFQGLVGKKSSSSSLHAMDVASYDYRSKGSGGQAMKITYHPIDFQGHSSVYQCFLTRRCLYLCVWNASHGKRGLSALLPWLRTLHSCIPRATAILIGTHTDQVSPFSMEEVHKWQREVFHTDDISKLKVADQASALGLPRITQCVLANSRLRDNIDNLKKEIHAAVLDLQVPHSHEKLVEELVPRSYIELQGLVETKVKHLHQKAGILTYEEFIDSFHSFSFRNWDLDEDEDEFALACEFLYDVGVIVRHSSSQPGLSDLFFLNPQWLSDTLVAIMSTCQEKVEESAGTIAHSQLLRLLEESQVPDQFQQEFISMMERHNLLVALDMDRKKFLIPSLLPPVQPSQYPQYQLSSLDITVQYISFNYLPASFFSHLQSRILMYIHLLAAELASLIPDLKRNMFSPSQPQNESGKISRAKMKKSFTIGQGGYVAKENADEGEENFEIITQRVRAISNVDPSSTAQRDSLHHKLMALFHPIKDRLPSFPNRALSCCWVTTEDGLSRSLLWKKGMYMQFLDNTEAWIELHRDSITIITSGEPVARIKALTFLRSSFDTISDERYPRLSQVAYCPCSQCLRRFNSEDKDFSFSMSSVELDSCDASNQTYSDCGPTATCSSDKSADTSSRETSSVMAAFHNKRISFFPVHSLILSLTTPQPDLLCSYCNIRADLSEVSPDTLLTDFSETLLLSPELFEFTACDSSRLGKGGYSDVYSGCYDGKPVAVKLFKEKWRGGAIDPTTPFQSLRAELGILTNISHAHVLSPQGVTLHPLSLVFDLAPLGSLRDHINLCPCGMSDQLCHVLLYQIASGISYLHSLYIIHRDIKPSNVLVWSLDPRQGVHIKIADCGLSQFSTPSGLHRPKGTEDYMAPELFKSGRNTSYHEKIDIFSFGVVLYNVVTGKKLDPGFLRQHKSHGLSFAQPRLGRAVADAMQEQRPCGSHNSPAHLLLEDGVHPASRQGHVSNCVVTCMQKVLDDCLAIIPANRPTAEGIRNRLCICTGPFRQEKIIVDHDYLLSWAGRCCGSASSSLIAWRRNDEKLMFITPEVWAVTQSPLLVKEVNAIAVLGDQVIVSSDSTSKLYAFSVPDMKALAVSLYALPSTVTCLFSSQATRQIAVGMEGGWMAMFGSDDKVLHQLEGTPKLVHVMDHPDPRKTVLSCGLFSGETVLCAVGRCLVGLDSRTLQQKFYKPLTDVRGAIVSKLVSTSSGQVWTQFAKGSEIAVSDIATGNKLDSIDLSCLLSGSYPSVIYSVSVSSIASQGTMVWVGTNTGQVIGFDSSSLEVTVAISSLRCVDALVALDNEMMVVFGRWAADEKEPELMGGFSVWRSQILMHST